MTRNRLHLAGYVAAASRAVAGGAVAATLAGRQAGGVYGHVPQ